MEAIRSRFWITILPAVLVTSWILVEVLTHFIWSDVTDFGLTVKLVGVVADIISAALIYLRLGRSIKPIGDIDQALFGTFAIGVLFVVFG